MNEYLLFAALLGLIFAIVGFSLVVSSMRAKKRTKALHAAAGERNLAFFEKDEHRLVYGGRHQVLRFVQKLGGIIQGRTLHRAWSQSSVIGHQEKTH